MGHKRRLWREWNRHHWQDKVTQTWNGPLSAPKIKEGLSSLTDGTRDRISDGGSDRNTSLCGSRITHAKGQTWWLPCSSLHPSTPALTLRQCLAPNKRQQQLTWRWLLAGHSFVRLQKAAHSSRPRCVVTDDGWRTRMIHLWSWFERLLFQTRTCGLHWIKINSSYWILWRLVVHIISFINT